MPSPPRRAMEGSGTTVKVALKFDPPRLLKIWVGALVPLVVMRVQTESV